MNRATLFKHGEFLVQQLLLQGIQFAVGIFMIRWLSKEEYGLYFLLTSCVAIVAVIGSSGLSAGINGVVAPLIGDVEAVSSAYATYFSIRKVAALGALAVVVPIAWWMIHRQGVHDWKMLSLICYLVVTAVTQLGLEVVTNPIKVLGGFTEIARTSTITTLALAPVTLAAMRMWPTAECLCLMAAAGFLIQTLWLKKLLKKKLNLSAKSDPLVKKQLVKSFFSLLPNSAYYALQGQVSTFILGTFGSVGNVAEVGAMSRFSRAYVSVDAYQQNVISPKLTRTRSREDWMKTFRLSAAGMAAIAAMTVLAMWLLPSPFLALLGDSYKNLSKELLWYSLIIAQNIIIGVVVQANTSRGWFHWSSRFQIIASISGIVLGVILCDLSSVIGVLQMGLLSRIPVFFTQLADLLHGYKNFKES